MTAKSLSRAALAALESGRPWALFLAFGWLAMHQTSAWGQGQLGQGRAFKEMPKANASGNAGIPVGSIGNQIGGALGGSGGGFGQIGQLGPRFEFKIAPNTPLQNLLPTPPLLPQPQPPWLVNELIQIPEVFFQKAKGLNPQDLEGKTAAEKDALVKEFSAPLSPSDVSAVDVFYADAARDVKLRRCRDDRASGCRRGRSGS